MAKPAIHDVKTLAEKGLLQSIRTFKFFGISTLGLAVLLSIFGLEHSLITLLFWISAAACGISFIVALLIAVSNTTRR